MRFTTIITAACLTMGLGSPSSATNISYTYWGENFTTKTGANQNLFGSSGMLGFVRIEFDASVLTPNDVTGTYTFSGGPNGIVTFMHLSSGNPTISSSDPQDIIDPLSFITFNHGIATDWAIQGTQLTTIFMQSTPQQDVVISTCTPGTIFPNSNRPCIGVSSAIVEDAPGLWQQTIGSTSFPVPGPLAGAGLPGLMLAGAAWLMRRRRHVSTDSAVSTSQS